MNSSNLSWNLYGSFFDKKDLRNKLLKILRVLLMGFTFSCLYFSSFICFYCRLL